MASAIELYREAYELDFRKGDWESAEDLYRKIVSRFPHSDEKEYALVHLERIEMLKGGGDDPGLAARGESRPGNGLGLFNFFLILLLLLGVGALAYFSRLQSLRIDALEQVLQSLK